MVTVEKKDSKSQITRLPPCLLQKHLPQDALIKLLWLQRKHIYGSGDDAGPWTIRISTVLPFQTGTTVGVEKPLSIQETYGTDLQVGQASLCHVSKKDTHAHALVLTTGLSPSAFNLPITGNSQVNNSDFNSPNFYLDPKYVSSFTEKKRIPIRQTNKKKRL